MSMLPNARPKRGTGALLAIFHKLLTQGGGRRTADTNHN